MVTDEKMLLRRCLFCAVIFPQYVPVLSRDLCAFRSSTRAFTRKTAVRRMLRRGGGLLVWRLRTQWTPSGNTPATCIRHCWSTTIESVSDRLRRQFSVRNPFISLVVLLLVQRIRCLDTLPATWLTIAGSSPTPA